MKTLNWTAEAFKNRDFPSARLEAEVLLAHAAENISYDVYILLDATRGN